MTRSTNIVAMTEGWKDATATAERLSDNGLRLACENAVRVYSDTHTEPDLSYWAGMHRGFDAVRVIRFKQRERDEMYRDALQETADWMHEHALSGGGRS